MFVFNLSLYLKDNITTPSCSEESSVDVNHLPQNFFPFFISLNTSFVDTKFVTLNCCYLVFKWQHSLKLKTMAFWCQTTR